VLLYKYNNVERIVMQNWEEYEASVLEHVQYYTLTEFFGRAKYTKDKPTFKTKQQAIDAFVKAKTEDPKRRLLVYAICRPPDRAVDITIHVETPFV